LVFNARGGAEITKGCVPNKSPKKGTIMVKEKTEKTIENRLNNTLRQANLR
jgi:hypothetical protein